MFTILLFMSVKLKEPIRVGAVFSVRSMRPVWFSRNGRQVRIREITYTWETRIGSAKIMHFAAADGQGLYELCFNSETFEWRVEQAEDEL